MYLSFGKKTTKEIIMNTWFKDALNKFADTNDFYDVIKGFMSSKKHEKEITLVYPESDYENDVYNNGIDLFMQYYSNNTCSNIEIWVREFDNSFNIIGKQKLCAYDVVNDVWDSILATEEYTEKELLDLPAGEYESIAQETICQDIADILYNWLE